MNNKEEQIKVYVMIGTIIMLIVIFSGITYAFFSASNNKGSTSVVEVKSGKMTISYADGKSSLLVSKDIQPSNKIIIDKTFTLTGTNTTSGLAMPYKVGLNYVSEFSDGQIHYYIKRTNTNTNVTSTLVGTTNQTIPGNTTETGYTHGTLKKGNKYLELATGEFKANTSNQTITFNLKIQFPDTGVSQDSEKGKKLIGEIVVNYEDKPVLLEYISKLDEASNGLEVDDTLDKNLRYVGTNPKNYVEFNNEIWRIIGVFNNITSIDEEGIEKKESLVKIVRNDSLGEFSWDISESSINGYGVNKWSQADLMYELNCDGNASSKYCRSDITDGYLSNNPIGESTNWYNGRNNEKNGTYEYKNNIKSDFIDKLAIVRWNTNSPTYDSSVLNSYNQERSTPSSSVPRTNIWDGKVALIYPSDFGYASTNEACRNNMYSSTSFGYSRVYSCTNENWLYKNQLYWTLSPSSSRSDGVLFVSGYVYYSSSYDSIDIFPTVFLKSDVKITSGTGEKTKPYILI